MNMWKGALEHVEDHNVAPALYNILEGSTVPSVPIPTGIYVEYLELAANPDLLIWEVTTSDANDTTIAAEGEWPNGQPSIYTATVSTAFPGSVDAYSITYGSPVIRTYAQPTVTRNANGAVINRPALTVA